MSEPGPESNRRLVGLELQDGRYVVSGVLGEGSQGATLEAIDKTDGTLVAIKRFQVRGAKSWKDVELAEREARVLARLSHPLLPRAIAYFEEGGALYLVMDRIEGKTLGQEQRLDRADVIRFLHDADRVLAFLHGQAPPVIHRDIKPANVIRRPSPLGTPEHVLVDFGSVRDSLKPAGGSTVVGTFGYMAPEQFQGRALPQSDIYAVGATALRMLTGSEPETLPHKGLAIDVKAALPGDPVMARVLTRLLEPDPDKRPTRILPILAELALELPRDEVPVRVDERATRSERRRAKREKRQRRRAPRPRPRRGVPPLVVPIVVIALSLARVAVSVTMRAAVPTLLMLMSLVFGDGLKRAARAVSRAGVVADEAMHRATRRVFGRDPEPEEAAGGARIEDVPAREARIGDVGRDALDDVDAAIEEAAEEIEALRDRRSKRQRRG